MNQVKNIYSYLFNNYGPQGWWPILDYKGVNPTKTGSIHGYHPGDYSFPRSKDEQFEIIIGSVLTQNTAWPNVEKALGSLKKLKAINPKRILALNDEALKEAIRPAGYFNQKAIYLKEMSKFYISLNRRTPTRKELLKVKGVGNETADSILLYAYKQPEFVVDAYTKRIFSNLGLISEKARYEEIKKLLEDNLPKEVVIFQEYHALIVEHAKRNYSKKPYDDPLYILCCVTLS